METPTGVSVSIEQLKKSYDAEVKNFLREKQILAVILKSCVPEFRDCSLSDIAGKYIEGEPSVSSAPIDQDMKVRDAGLDNTGSKITGLSNEDRSIKKVYSIWICRNVPKDREHSIVAYDIRERIVAEHYRVKAEAAENYDLMSVVLPGLGDPGIEETDAALRLLSTAFSEDVDADTKKEILSDDFGIAMTENIGGTVERMCNLSSGIEERAEARGIERDIEQGIEQGLEQKTVESMNRMISLGYPDSEIAVCLSVPEERVLAARRVLSA